MAVMLFRKGGSQKFDEYTFVDRLKEGWFLSEEEAASDCEIIHTPCNETVEKCKCDDAEVRVIGNGETGLPKNKLHPGYGRGSGPDAAEWKKFDQPEQIAEKGPSNKQIRVLAKKAGVKNWKKARIQSLKKALKL
jgi:hypothetical protein